MTDVVAVHEEGCPCAGTDVPATNCSPCGWIRLGKELGYRLARDEQSARAVLDAGEGP